MSGARGPGAVDELWQLLVEQVMESLGGWRKRVTEVTGLPFSRMRILRRLAPAPLSLHELAEAADCDAPAATVAVNDLESRGLVERTIHPSDRRAKLVSLTRAGRVLVKKEQALSHETPELFAKLSAKDIADFTRILRKLKT